MIGRKSTVIKRLLNEVVTLLLVCIVTLAAVLLAIQLPRTHILFLSEAVGLCVFFPLSLILVLRFATKIVLRSRRLDTATIDDFQKKRTGEILKATVIGLTGGAGMYAVSFLVREEFVARVLLLLFGLLPAFLGLRKVFSELPKLKKDK